MNRTRLIAGAASAALLAGGLVVAGSTPASADTVDYAPYRIVSDKEKRFRSLIGIAVLPNGTTYVADSPGGSGWDSIWILGRDADGKRSPRRIYGDRTGLTRLDDVAVDDAGKIYALSGKQVHVFARGASGNVAPVRSFTVQSTYPGALAVSRSGAVAVAGLEDVEVYAAGATGSPTPQRVIGGPSLNFAGVVSVAFDSTGRLWVLDDFSRVLGFAPTANGDETPTNTLEGGALEEWNLEDVAVDRQDRVYVMQLRGPISSPSAGISVFRSGANREVPLRTLSGPRSLLATAPYGGIAVDARGDILHSAVARRQVFAYRTLFPTRPSAVRSVRVTGKTRAAKRTVRWVRPANDGGRAIRSYKLVFRKGSKTLKTVTLKPNRRSYKVSTSKLRKGRLTVTVRAKTTVGWSPKVVKRFRVR